MSNRRQRKTYEDQSVIAWMRSGETYAAAKERLDAAWERGDHPSQVQAREKQRRQ